jgi:hypothetical protein
VRANRRSRLLRRKSALSCAARRATQPRDEDGAYLGAQEGAARAPSWVCEDPLEEKKGCVGPPLAIVCLEHNLTLKRWPLTKGADRSLKGGSGRLP